MMGLDITAYSKVSIVKVDDEDDTLAEYCFHALVNDNFPDRANGLESFCFYSYDESMCALSLSYSTYNWWREKLSELAGYPLTDYVCRYTGESAKRYDAGAWNAKGGPFWELINFSDCEGCIGTATSAKLLADFDSFAARASEHQDVRFYPIYRQLHDGVKLAADGGALEFH